MSSQTVRQQLQPRSQTPSLFKLIPKRHGYLICLRNSIWSQLQGQQQREGQWKRAYKGSNRGKANGRGPTRAATEGRPMEEGLPEEANAISQTTETLTVSRLNLNNQVLFPDAKPLQTYSQAAWGLGAILFAFGNSIQLLGQQEANAISQTTETLTVSRQNLNNQLSLVPRRQASSNLFPSGMGSGRHLICLRKQHSTTRTAGGQRH